MTAATSSGGRRRARLTQRGQDTAGSLGFVAGREDELRETPQDAEAGDRDDDEEQAAGRAR